MEPLPSGGRPAGRTIDANGTKGGAGVDIARLLAGDRERIGHDLHDLVIRSLFDVSLKLHGALPLIEDDLAEQRVGDALGDIDQIITNVRLAVFALLNTRPAEPGLGLRRQVVELVDEIGQRIDHHPTLALDGPIDAVTDIRSAEGLITVLRELLLGLARHAGARASQVRLAARIEPRPHLRVQVLGERPADQTAERPPDLHAWLDEVRDHIDASDGGLVADVRPRAITLSWIVSTGCR